MATLDDKLMGEKLQYYCSSSEDEGHEDSDADDGNESSNNKTTNTDSSTTDAAATGGSHLSKWDGTSCNTGPKGVIKDYQRFKQLEKERREDQKEELAQLAKKFAITCRTNAEDEDAKLEAELNELMNDSSIHQFVQQRMQEMVCKDNVSHKTFGSVVKLRDSDQFLAAVDDEDKGVCVVVLLYEPGRTGCNAALRSLHALARNYPKIKCCTVQPSLIAMSSRFESGGVPALLSYRAGQLTANLVRLTDDLGGDDFEDQDFEALLIEHGIVQDRLLSVPASSFTTAKSSPSSDED